MMNEETHTEACGNEPEELTRESEVSADAEVVDSDQQPEPLSDEAIAALAETARASWVMRSVSCSRNGRSLAKTVSGLWPR